MKRGQVTLFILLGLLVLLFVGFFVFYARQHAAPQPAIEHPIAASLRTTFSSCLEQQLNEAISFLALHGGYYQLPEKSVEEYFSGNISLGVPYYFYDTQNIVPSQQEVEQQLSMALQDKVLLCANFSAFQYPVTLLSSAPSSEGVITFSSVQATIHFPLQVFVENTAYTVDTFPIEVPSRIYTLFTAAENITTEQTRHPEELCLTCLSVIAGQENLYLGMIETQQENQYTVIYVLNDRDPEAEQPLSFYFAHTFFLENITSVYPTLELKPIANQIAVIGYPFSYKIIGSGTGITYSDDSSLFDVHPETGMISFTPQKEDVGSWIVTITATDANGMTADTSFVLTITDVVSSELSVEPLPYFIAYIGEPFAYTVNVTAENPISFLDDTPLFDIDRETGRIAFTPASTDKGSHNFTITVVDTVGNFVEQNGYIVVVEK